jgi:hypothetical protein
MAIGAIKQENSLKRYMTEVGSVWGDGKDPKLPFTVKGLLEERLTSISSQAPWTANFLMLSWKEMWRSGYDK